MSAELDLDDVCAGNPLAERQLAELRAEVATPVLVATNRLADALADARAEIAKLRAEREELIEAGNVMRRFIMSWRDCLDGVQMSEASFIRDCGIARWNRALAEKGE